MDRKSNPSGTDWIVLRMRGASKTDGAVTIDAYQIQSRGPLWHAQSGVAPNIAVVGTYSGGSEITETDYALQVIQELGPFATLAEAQAAAGLS
jgi:hypothetical protein